MTSKTESSALALTLEQTRAFEEILAVFETPGWRRLHAQLLESQARAADVRQTTDLAFAKGQLDVLDNLVNWKNLWSQLYDGAVAGTIEVSPEFGR